MLTERCRFNHSPPPLSLSFSVCLSLSQQVTQHPRSFTVTGQDFYATLTPLNTSLTQLCCVFSGDKDDVSIPGFGEKFIGVTGGGILHMHGTNQKSWSKLTSTVRKLKDGELSDVYVSNRRFQKIKVLKSAKRR